MSFYRGLSTAVILGVMAFCNEFPVAEEPEEEELAQVPTLFYRNINSCPCPAALHAPKDWNFSYVLRPDCIRPAPTSRY